MLIKANGKGSIPLSNYLILVYSLQKYDKMNVIQDDGNRTR